jgi:tetratricopeptide (TPR) repeat protein
MISSVCGLALLTWQARADLPRWMQDAVSGSAIEAALYRAMEIPGVKALYPSPPKEAQGELNGLIAKAPAQAELYSLRAMEEERALDFTDAERDWKTYALKAGDSLGAKWELADYYHRRLQSKEEVGVLMEVGSAPAQADEKYTAAAEQRSWKALERVLVVAADQGMDEDVTLRAYAAWIARYPQQPSLYSREFGWLLEQKKDALRFDKARALIAQYAKAFPSDAVFPMKATALLEYRQGSIDKSLATYDAGFAPLWPAELVESYYALLKETHNQRRFLADAHERLAKNPDDLNAMARLFYYAQQQGNLPAAQEVIQAYRLSKESRKGSWSAQELYTLASLTEAVHAYPEAARYDFALYHAQGKLDSGGSPQETGLSGIVRILLTAPDEPVELGANNLSLYRDVATLDRGPGYWNGILSLWLNSESPQQSYHEEEQKAQPYFHRAKAAELLATLDRDYPKAAERAELHQNLIQAFAGYGENALVVKEGNAFLTDFTAAGDESNRVSVAMLVADAYARQRDTKDEFALYDRLLTELGQQTAGMPLTAASASAHGIANAPAVQTSTESQDSDNADGNSTSEAAAKKVEKSRAFEVTPGMAVGVFVAGSEEYRQLLERYLGRLTAEGQLPQALAVLRKELDRNPNDPLLYERLADFLQQNNLSAQQEEVYAQAIEKFQDRGWYDKLARLYLREKKREAYAELTKKVVGIFSGTELEEYFRNANGAGAQLYLQLNLYAHQRFPHDAVFVQNLLGAYRAKGTYDQVAWEKLMREHWSDNVQLQREFFDYLSSHDKLDEELAQLRTLVPDAKEQQANPDATRELAEVEMWQSHFEASAPLVSSLAASYPADEEIGTEASSVLRSLAYDDPAQSERAVDIEKHLLEADPANMDRLARIGDIYSDSGADSSASSSAGHENLAAAAPYWRRMPMVHPGTPDGYLQAATIFWDYFQFDDALGEIRAARTKFDEPALYGYEAGAIDEGKRDFVGAIAEYTQAAIADATTGEPAARLLQLARRKAWAKTVDAETAKALETGPGIAALELRERVLETQKRSAEIDPLLATSLSKATTLDEAEAIGAEAQTHSLTGIYEQALKKEMALAGDPVQKIELSYALARSYEGRKNLDAATQQMEQVYRENPKLLGVVRATADFYWRNKQSAKAIATLIAASDAAKAAQPALSRQFTVEAADKANDSGSYAQARALMAPLIQSGDDAYNAQYLGVVAQSYARAGDDVGLKQFYLEKLTAIKTSAMTADDRKQKTVLLRRGLIPALTGMKDYAGAVDQYIAILSAYPEDATTAQETALYALRYARQAQLVDFLNTTVKTSPRDSRFAILLGQIETVFEDFPAAVDAYAHAITIRSDRADLYQAKADLEERLQRLDDACKDYERLYVLSYQNPDWMVKIAAVRARQGRKDEVVKALERAWIEGHPATASDYFRVAKQLESWNLLDESLRFAELGVKVEGDALLAGGEPGDRKGDDADGAVIYTRLLTRMRQQEKALTVLDAALADADASPNSPGLVVEQVEKQGLASVTNAEWRKRQMERRQSTAAARYEQALKEMGKTAGAYFTPEEKLQFAKLVDGRWKAAQRAVRVNRLLWIDVASAAGIKDEEAALRKEVLLDVAGRRNRTGDAELGPYSQLEDSRMEYRELAETLDSYALGRSAEGHNSVLADEAQAYRKAGDEKAEFGALSRINYARNTGNGEEERYLALLLKRDAGRFATFGAKSSDEELAMTAPNYAAAHGDVKIARATLSARASAFPGAWETAYSALLGLYFHDVSAETDASFHRLLADQLTVAERILNKVHSGGEGDDPGDGPGGAQSQLAGGIWFQYGMRYGVYRTLAPAKEWAQRDPEDFLASELERNPTAANYVGLARAYADAGESSPAIAEYRHALELAPDSPGIHDAIALIDWQGGKKDEAIAEWRLALAALDRIQKKGPAPESYWTGFTLIARHLGSRKLTAQLHAEMDAVLRDYLKVNGDYRSLELLQAAFEASASPAEGSDWLLSLANGTANPGAVLSSFDDAAWLPEALREPVLLKEIELARIAAARQTAPQAGEYDYSAQRLVELERKLALLYAAQRQDAKAEAILDGLTQEQRSDPEVMTAELELAARAHRVAAFLNGFRVQTANSSGTIPQMHLQTLRDVAATLSADGYKAEALTVWEFVFEQLQLQHDLMTSDYLGLAEARLEVGKLPEAVALLRRMTLLPEDGGAAGADFGGMGNFDHAAALLVEKGHDAEALEFLAAMAKGVPWNAAYALRLAQAQLRVGVNKAEALAALATLAADADRSYDLRAQAAVALKGLRADGSKFGSDELRLLAAGKVTPQEARQPYFAAARIAAAGGVADATGRAALLRQAIAIAPLGAASAEGFRENDVRLGIFHAEAASGNAATALAAVEPLLIAPNLYPGYQGREDVDGEGGSAKPGNADGSLGLSDEAASSARPEDKTLAQLTQQAPLPAGQRTDAESMALAAEIAQVYEKNESPAQALPYLELAAYWEKDSKRHAEMEGRIGELTAAQRVEAENALRRPKIQKALNQSAVVRPRLRAADLSPTEAP